MKLKCLNYIKSTVNKFLSIFFIYFLGGRALDLNWTVILMIVQVDDY